MEIIKIIDCLSGTEHRDVLVKVHDQDEGAALLRSLPSGVAVLYLDRSNSEHWQANSDGSTTI